jgi:hypothetical protein
MQEYCGGEARSLEILPRENCGDVLLPSQRKVFGGTCFPRSLSTCFQLGRSLYVEAELRRSTVEHQKDPWHGRSECCLRAFLCDQCSNRVEGTHFTCCVSYQIQQLLLNANNSLIVRTIPNKCFASVAQAEASNFQPAFTADHALCVEFGRQRRSPCFRFCFPLPSISGDAFFASWLLRGIYATFRRSGFYRSS